MKHLRGFTLLEVLVAMTTLVAVMSIASASFGRFNRRETIRQASVTLKTNLQSLKFRAINGQKPLGMSCVLLNGYTITFSTSAYEYQATCTPVQDAADKTTVTLPPNVTFSPVPSAILFKSLGSGTDSALTVVITMVIGTESYILHINPDGEIVDLGLQ